VLLHSPVPGPSLLLALASTEGDASVRWVALRASGPSHASASRGFPHYRRSIKHHRISHRMDHGREGHPHIRERGSIPGKGALRVRFGWVELACGPSLSAHGNGVSHLSHDRQPHGISAGTIDGRLLECHSHGWSFAWSSIRFELHGLDSEAPTTGREIGTLADQMCSELFLDSKSLVPHITGHIARLLRPSSWLRPSHSPSREPDGSIYWLWDCTRYPRLSDEP